jgi:hypothetical protein
MERVKDLQARIDVKKEVMEEEQHEHARRHAQLQSVVEAKMEEATELRGRLNDIVLAFECSLCFETLVKGSVSFGCGHTYCNRATCGSCLVDTCPECRLPVASRVQLFGALPDVGALLEKEPAAPDVEQVQRLALDNAKASLEEIRKRSEEDKAVWQREREEMQQQVNRLREEVLAAANANASLEEIRVQQNDQINKLLTSEKMRTKQVTPELDAERLGKKDALQQHVAEQTKKRLSDGNKEQNAVPAAASRMQCHRQNAVQSPPNKKQKQNMPGEPSDADSLFATIVTQGDEAAIIQGMLTHSEHARVQQQACDVLNCLAYRDGKRSKIAEAGGIEAVVAAMKAHKTSVHVQKNACAALCNLAVNDGNKLKIAEAGGIEAVVAGMKAHKARVLVQQPACAALRNLAINDGNKLKIAEAGGIEAVVAAMKAHRRNVYMQQHACWALRYLAVNDSNQVKIAEAGGIEAVVTAMDHNREVLVEEPACAALWYLAAQGSLRQRIKTAGGVQCVKHAVNSMKATTETKSLGNDLLDKLE